MQEEEKTNPNTPVNMNRDYQQYTEDVKGHIESTCDAGFRHDPCELV
jgi:hypothetical protein